MRWGQHPLRIVRVNLCKVNVIDLNHYNCIWLGLVSTFGILVVGETEIRPGNGRAETGKNLEPSKPPRDCTIKSILETLEAY